MARASRQPRTLQLRLLMSGERETSTRRGTAARMRRRRERQVAGMARTRHCYPSLARRGVAVVWAPLPPVRERRLRAGSYLPTAWDSQTAECAAVKPPTDRSWARCRSRARRLARLSRRCSGAVCWWRTQLLAQLPPTRTQGCERGSCRPMRDSPRSPFSIPVWRAPLRCPRT